MPIEIALLKRSPWKQPRRTASRVRRTSTPARARSIIASISIFAASPFLKMYVSMFTDDSAARMASRIAG